MDSNDHASESIRFGSFELNSRTGELLEQGRVRKLAAQPFKVLCLLVERAGETVTRLEIQRCLWGDRRYIDVDRGINFCLNQIRSALRDPADQSNFIRTLPRKGYRFVATTTRHCRPAIGVADTPPIGAAVTAIFDPVGVADSAPRWRPWLIVLACLSALVLLGSIPAARRWRNLALAPRHIILIDDFTNTTDDPVFDDTLKQALTIEIGQSAYFDVLPGMKVRQTLKLMGFPNDARISADRGQRICARTGSNVVLDGKISPVGHHFVVGVNAVECASLHAIASEQIEAENKEEVLKALSVVASRLRTRLGESIASLQQFDVPIEATTASLEALKSYSLGHKVALAQGDSPSIPFYLRAVELDPDFAAAYAALAARFNNIAEASLASEYARKAYLLRDRGTERERLSAMSLYWRLLGNLHMLSQTLDIWKQEYPRDGSPYGSQGVNFIFLGQYKQALDQLQEAVARQPDNVVAYENLALVYLALNQTAAARTTIDTALDRSLDSAWLRRTNESLAFMEHDQRAMQRQQDWATGKPGTDDILLDAQSDIEAYFGHLQAARELSRRAVASAVASNHQETAGLWEALLALREAEFGTLKEARESATAALAISQGRNVRVIAALALARSGDRDSASVLFHDLEQQESDNSVLMMLRLPSIRAAVALDVGSPQAAIDELQPGQQYDLGKPTPSGFAVCYPIYLRGLAYLALQNGAAAEREFRRIIDNPGIALYSPVGAFARLGIARAKVQRHELSAAKAAYEQFLNAWKTADAGVPVVIAARREYEELARSMRY